MAFSKNPAIGKRVAVVGLGCIGLSAMKNLLEQGLEVTAFERNHYVGGIWHATSDTKQISALPITTCNTSKQVTSFTDFPFPDDVQVHPRAIDVERYFESYAEHFGLLPHIQFSTDVVKIERDEARSKWVLFTKPVTAASSDSAKTSTREFDRVVIATGGLNRPYIPKFKGIDQFQGDFLHSREFKEHSKYKGKNVLVVGVGATSVDSVSFLKEAKAGKIYLSHRGSFRLPAYLEEQLPRMVDGKAFDWNLSRRLSGIARIISAISPAFFTIMMNGNLAQAQAKAFPQLSNHPSFSPPRKLDPPTTRVPVFSTDFADNLVNGTVQSVVGISHISGPNSVTLTDGVTLSNIDAILVCSGYEYDFSTLPPCADPSNPSLAPDNYRKMKATANYNAEFPFAWLYKGFLSTAYPDSLAVLGHVLMMKSPFPLYDIISMALAQLWTGKYPLPSADEMATDINSHYELVVSLLEQAQVPHPGFRMANSASLYYYINEVAGTGVTERLGAWGGEAWKLWWRDRKLYNMLMNGIDSPHVYRLFETGRGRKPWSGARQAIEKANRDMTESEKAWKHEQESNKDR